MSEMGPAEGNAHGAIHIGAQQYHLSPELLRNFAALLQSDFEPCKRLAVQVISSLKVLRLAGELRCQVLDLCG